MASAFPIRPSLNRALRARTVPTLSTASQTLAYFSTTASQCRRKTKDNNRFRGVSSLYRSGPREPLSMSGIPLPKPREFKPTAPIDNSHGLWGFFPEPGKALWTPEETVEHGRAWTVEELRKKSWDDLHSLWWVCCRERNMLATSKNFLEREKIGFGDHEIDERDAEVRKTMRAIKHTLTERYYTWQDAVEVAAKDPEINLQGGPDEVYKPDQYEDDVDWEEELAKEEAEKEALATTAPPKDQGPQLEKATLR
ncbi:hypothetical protein S7711_03521 [Stachybotrys chartarum IBT 7711]|uniref:Large ribosomal subunit protein uL29m n=1 Tax=Stachybotrys chartarum (strain CBS 109288 / IBT 7711) TaxID=1280523 RepID=A0A084B1M5_STACB|nr:hypothetical protein S7711_03521 [Stachybotrys chartarum IBT 7711]KFA51671.1 hypothetical protein S40293_02757 [Stachybotrys chartarum IBT 40293]KFA71980.1 hypothetical protein S40288_06237 [Stachybotrys chartarum IBT 40288]